MTGRAGIIGARTSRRAPLDVDRSLALAGWRGQEHQSLRSGGLELVAIGRAELAQVRGIVVAFHGRLDELEALADRFGCAARAAEVIAAGYDELGRRLAAELSGSFAFIVADGPRDRLWAVRDWIGSKPLFWHRDQLDVVVGSEALWCPLALNDLPKPNETAIRKYLAVEDPQWASFVDGVASIPNGAELTASTAGLQMASTNRAQPQIDMDPAPQAKVRVELEAAVKRALSGHSITASTVSSGLDSSAITLLAALQNTSGHVAFTHRVLGLPEVDESIRAQELCAAAGVPLVAVDVVGSDVVEKIESMILIFGPSNPNYWPTAAVFEASRQRGATVLLNGFGADEWLMMGGSGLVHALWNAEWRAVPEQARARAANGLSWSSIGVEASRGVVGRMLLGRRAPSMVFDSFRNDSVMNRTLLSLERLGALHDVESASPFLDEQVARLLVSLPAAVRRPVRRPKGVLRDALGDLYPLSYLSDPKKVDFSRVPGLALGRPNDASAAGEIRQTWVSAWRRQLATLH